MQSKNTGRRPARGPHNAKPLAERYWPNVDRSGGPDACWLWLAARLTRSGYGIISTHTVNGRAKTTTAHRVGLALARGVPITSIRPIVRHSCDNPPCQNPRHLEDGTQAENLEDMRLKGRRKRTGPPGGQLNEAAVRAIRERYAAGGISQLALAKVYGVNQGTVSSVIRRAIWKHVD